MRSTALPLRAALGVRVRALIAALLCLAMTLTGLAGTAGVASAATDKDPEFPGHTP